MNLWKVCGVASLAGVAAAGVIIARDKRQRAQLEPEEIRARLLERYEKAGPDPVTAAPSGQVNRPGRSWLDGSRWSRRR